MEKCLNYLIHLWHAVIKLQLMNLHKQDEELINEMIRELLTVRRLQNKYELNAQEAKEETENDFAKKSEEKRNFFDKWHKIGQTILEKVKSNQLDMKNFDKALRAEMSENLNKDEDALWDE